ncbi:MAG: ATP-binding cassette domain-containing protein [Cytophagales bacterium]|nr:MAG: ATP-binding cassette domain-containing protein [Cytophagales bacterium]TAF60332.1 MAG: ATP-binding cassette domain-containing protein [Cytophagales bacterium]
MAGNSASHSSPNGEASTEEKKKLNKDSLKHLSGIYRFMFPYRWNFVLGLLCLFASSVVMLAFPEFTGNLVDASTGGNPAGLSNINEIAILLISILSVQTIFSFARIYFFAQVGERSMADIRQALYKKYLQLPLTFYDKNRTGDMMSRMTADVALLQDSFSITLAEFFRQIIVLVVGLILLFYKNYQLTFFMLSIVPVLVVAAMFFGRKIKGMSKNTQDELAKTNVIVEETLQTISVVKAYTNELFELNRYRKTQQDVVKMALKTANFRGLFVSFIIFVVFGSIVAVLWYGALLIGRKELMIGELVTFIIYTMFIAGSIGGLGDIYSQIQKAIGASERILKILEEPIEPSPEEKPSFSKSPAAIQNIVYKDISFSYPTRADVQIFDALNFRIEAGEKVALVGYSGAGKSTIVQLLMRFYELQSGQILLNGQNIQDYDLGEYRNLIGIVPQEVILFGGSIRENIAYAKTGATDAEIIEAARQANALSFIESFPEGLNTLVGERGVKLSGGQKQRVAIARAILKDPKILILDEATSSLDAESEHLVQDALDLLMKNRTTIIIAHRLATVRKADRIYVLEKGKIVETGTHEHLLQNINGVYSQLIKLQVSEA